MKTFYLLPLLFLSACSTSPKLALRPQPALSAADTVRYPEVLHAYHLGRYADPNNDSLMHEQHIVYRVEENTRWDLHPANVGDAAFFPAAPVPRDAAFSPAPVNDAILAEVNSQRLATAQIMGQAHTLSAVLMQFQSALQQTRTNFQQTAALRVTVSDLKQRLDALESAPGQIISTTNITPDPLRP